MACKHQNRTVVLNSRSKPIELCPFDFCTGIACASGGAIAILSTALWKTDCYRFILIMCLQSSEQYPDECCHEIQVVNATNAIVGHPMGIRISLAC